MIQEEHITQITWVSDAMSLSEVQLCRPPVKSDKAKRLGAEIHVEKEASGVLRVWAHLSD